MSDFIVSARKYRPDTFKSVVGQASITNTLINSIATHKLAHAYLFCGPRGVGKTTCARIFAKTINCTNIQNGEACNECESCKSFNKNISMNIHEMDAASNNSVEDIRLLIDQVRISPQMGQYSVYIIDEIHMLSSQAFNAFLKTLEEPPAHAIFIMATTEKHKILPTILSRCQIFDFNRISVNDISEHLAYVAGNEEIKFETEALHVIANKADGGMRDALSIFDQISSFTGANITYNKVIENLNVLDDEYFFQLSEAFNSSNLALALSVLENILLKGFEGSQILTGLALHFRNILVSTDEKTIALLELSEQAKSRFIEAAKSISIQFIYDALGIINEFELTYKQSQNKRLHVELSFIKLCQIKAEQEKFELLKKKLS
jgi:DNA polymerase-3 subunit gamma/tau